MPPIPHLPRNRLLSIRNSRLFSSAVPPGSTNTNPRNALRIIRNVSLAAGLGLTTYTIGALFPPQSLTFIAPRPAPGPPSDINSPSSLAYIAKLESELQSLPLLAALRSQPDADEWYEARPYRDVPEERRVNSLTAGALRGPGKLSSMPLVRARKDESESIIIVHVGRGLCGHDGIVHGGLLATLLDEGLGRTVRVMGIHLFHITDCHAGFFVSGDNEFTRESRSNSKPIYRLSCTYQSRSGNYLKIVANCC